MKRGMRRYLLVLPILALLFASLNCTVNLSGEDNNLAFTQTALALQQTSLVLQNDGINATLAAQQATLNAAAGVQPTAAPPQVEQPSQDLVGTQIAISVQQTAMAGAAVQPPEPVSVEATEPPVVAPPVAPPPVEQPSENLEEQMKGASILVYEDIVVDPSEYQYVKKTLDAMGLRYKWDGNALGWLKNDMLTRPNGKPWDLIIIAAEIRSEVSGEYFDYLNDALNAGTSVIVEAWHLDEIDQGTISPILAHCGVQVYPYMTDGTDINDAIIWPISGAESPLLQSPNSGMRFTKARDKWYFSFDLGSKMALTGGGDAQLLLGTDAQDFSSDGVLATCMGGQFTLQTFSSHTFTYDVMYPLWENYIYNALKVRFSNDG